MAISLKRYVDITSGVGAGSSVSTRELNGRFYTTNELVPTGSYVEFTSADDVSTYFGSDSVEYDRAAFYFGWTSTEITSPQKISFARWVDVTSGSQIFGKVATYSLGTFTAITTGDFTLTLGGVTNHITSINMSGAASLSDVATLIESAINAFTGDGVAWTGAIVDYDATRKSFNLVSGATGDDVIAVTAGTTVDVAVALGWLSGSIVSNGKSSETVTEVLVASTDESNNFGSFAFVPTLTLNEVTEAATWNNTQNIMYMYSVPVTEANAAAWSAALVGIGGVTLTLSTASGEYPEQAPMMILAATNYARRNSVQNFMFKQFILTPSVTSNANKDIYDDLRINYYGETQTAGNKVSFYQTGKMMGLPVDPIDQNTYSNEIWLKDSIGAAIMTLLLALSRVSANSTGRAQLLTTLQSIIDVALFNGTISVGKPLTSTQKLYISSVTGDDEAWQQVQNIGYWRDVQIVSYADEGTTRYKAVYTLIYSKDDIIRLVEGTDILI